MEMTGDSGLACQHHIAAQHRAARNARLANKDGVLADHAVVGNHNQIVHPHPALDPGHAEGGPVHAAVGADLHVVVKAHGSHLRLADMRACGRVGGEAKAVAANDCAVMQHHPLAEDAAARHHGVGMKNAVVADLHIVANDHARRETHPLADSHPVAHAGQRGNADLAADHAVLTDHRPLVDTRRLERLGQQPAVNASRRQIHVADLDQGKRTAAEIQRGNAGRSPARGQLVRHLATVDEGQLTGFGQLKAVEGGDDGVAAAFDHSTDQLGQLRKTRCFHAFPLADEKGGSNASCGTCCPAG